VSNVETLEKLEKLVNTISTLTSALNLAISELDKCQDIFRDYALIHFAKDTTDADIKAQINIQHAERLHTVIAEIREELDRCPK
jgi:hypothetical protein